MSTSQVAALTAPEPAPYDDGRRRAQARRITGALLVSQSLGSAGTVAAATVASIVGAELSGLASLSGLPSAVNQVGIAFGSLLWSRLSDVWGRRTALTGGLLTGALGAVTAMVGVAIGSFVLVLVGLTVSGSGNASVQLGRFVAAEVTPRAHRAKAIATVVLGGTVGSVLGPALVAPTGRFMASLGFSEIAGPYIATAVGFFLTAGLLFTFLRPEPRTIGAELGAYERGDAEESAPRSLRQMLADVNVRVAVTCLVTAHMVMVGLMQMTSLHMHDHDHSLGSISLVFSSHTMGMFAFSVLSGWLTDRWGRKPVALGGAMLLLLSCALAPLSPDVLPIAFALFLLGLGWNLCYVAGSALLSDALTTAEKGTMQGFNDLVMGGAAASAVMLGGLVLGGAGYTTLALLGGIACLPLTFLVVRMPGARVGLRRAAGD
ncbi:MAG TPA: MFS transporter [Trueperaceae bacterium]|nr:MFS transporter [Trueperaceae bacterium]